MMTVNRIFVPVDFNEHSARALDCAKTLAEKCTASLHLLTVVPDPFELPNPGPWYVPPPSDYEEGLGRDAEPQLSGLLTSDEQKRLKAQSVVVFGDPYREILDYVKRGPSDLIVMGTHGRGGVAHAFMGRVAATVVRTAPCPVLTGADTGCRHSTSLA